MTPSAANQPIAFSIGHRTVLALAIPMMITHLSTPLVGLVATAVIGRLGDSALIAGVALASVIFDVVFVSCNFLRFATTGFTAQAVGANDRRGEYQDLSGAIWLALAMGVMLVASQALILAGGMAALSVDEALRPVVREYFFWRIWSAPFVLFNYVLFGWLLGRGSVLMALALQTFLNGVCIGLSIYLVLYLDLGVAGAAMASLFAEFATFAVGLLVMARTIDREAWKQRNIQSGWNWRRLLRVNLDLMVRSIALLVGVSLFTRQSATLGVDILAANTILLRLYFVSVAILDGFATAAEQLAGRAVGARYRPAFDFAIRATTRWGLGFAVALCLGLLFAGPVLIDMMAPTAAVRDIADRFLPWAAILPVAAVTAFQLDGVFVGATWSREMRNMMLLSLAVFIAAFTILQPPFGNHGLWIAMVIFQLARCAGFGLLLPRLAARTFPR